MPGLDARSRRGSLAKLRLSLNREPVRLDSTTRDKRTANRTGYIRSPLSDQQPPLPMTTPAASTAASASPPAATSSVLLHGAHSEIPRSPAVASYLDHLAASISKIRRMFCRCDIHSRQPHASFLLRLGLIRPSSASAWRRSPLHTTFNLLPVF